MNIRSLIAILLVFTVSACSDPRTSVSPQTVQRSVRDLNPGPLIGESAYNLGANSVYNGPQEIIDSKQLMTETLELEQSVADQIERNRKTIKRLKNE